MQLYYTYAAKVNKTPNKKNSLLIQVKKIYANKKSE